MSDDELIHLREVAELAGGNPNDSFWAAHRCAQQRVNIVTRYRGHQPVLYVAAADVPRFLGASHPVMRGHGWRFELSQLRRRHTRALKARATVGSREARLQAHLKQVAEEVEQALAQSRRGRWRTPTARR